MTKDAALSRELDNLIGACEKHREYERLQAAVSDIDYSYQLIALSLMVKRATERIHKRFVDAQSNGAGLVTGSAQFVEGTPGWAQTASPTEPFACSAAIEPRITS